MENAATPAVAVFRKWRLFVFLVKYFFIIYLSRDSKSLYRAYDHQIALDRMEARHLKYNGLIIKNQAQYTLLASDP